MNLLVVEDELAQRQILESELTRLGNRVVAVETGMTAVKELEENGFDVAITDLRLPDIDGIEVIRRARESGNDIPILVMTAYASMRSAISAVQVGATDYLIKPIRIADLVRRIEQIEEVGRLHRENQLLRRVIEQETKSYWFPETRAGEEVRRLIARVGSTDLTVLITGESGTGKGMTARLLHSVSARHQGPFVSVNCGAIPESLVESELFGYAQGAFTGADRRREGLFVAASGGTLFLDEINSLTLPMQAKLLHAIEERSVRPVGSTRTHPIDIRIIVASNGDLARLAREGRFREDLLFRLDVFQIPLPPLREQRDAIPSAVRFFLSKHARGHRERRVQLQAAVWERFMAHDWPGNLRELENAVERALVLSDGLEITLEDLPPVLQLQGGGSAAMPCRSLRERVAAFEHLTILQAIEAADGDRRRAARALGIGLSTLYRKLDEHGMRG